MGARVVIVMLAGCGRLNFGWVALDANSPVDAPCVLGPWSVPVHLAAASDPSADDYGAALSPDTLTLVFTSGRAGGMGSFDIYQATRATTADLFGPATNFTILNSSAREYSPAFSGDGLTLYFGSERSSVYIEMYVATRTTLADAFGPPSVVPEFAGMTADGPTLTSDDREMFYTQNEISRATHDASGFTLTGPVAELDMGSLEYPSITGDGLTIYMLSFASALLTYSATRPDRSSPFTTPALEPVLSDGGDSDDPEVSKDGRTIVFASNRIGGQYDLFMSTRACQ